MTITVKSNIVGESPEGLQENESLRKQPEAEGNHQGVGSWAWRKEIISLSTGSEILGLEEENNVAVLIRTKKRVLSVSEIEPLIAQGDPMSFPEPSRTQSCQNI